MGLLMQDQLVGGDLFEGSSQAPARNDDPDLAVRSCLWALTGALRDFQLAFQTDDNRVLWLRDGRGAGREFLRDSDSARQTVLEAVLAVTYRRNQKGPECFRWPGLVAAQPNTLLRLKLLNQAKDSLAAALRKVSGMQHHRTRRKLVLEAPDRLALSLELRRVLGRFGSSRLHVTQATRRIVVLDEMPQYVGFFWAASPKHIKSLAPDDAAAVAGQKGSADEFWQAYEQAPPDRKVLRVHTALKPHLRANLRWDHAGDEPKRRCVTCSMPLFYPASGVPPFFEPPSMEPPDRKAHPRKTRKDLITGLVPIVPDAGLSIGPESDYLRRRRAKAQPTA